MFFGVSSSVTECFQSVTDYLQPVTELGTPNNMAAALPGMTLQPLYDLCKGVRDKVLTCLKQWLIIVGSAAHSSSRIFLS